MTFLLSPCHKKPGGSVLIYDMLTGIKGAFMRKLFVLFLLPAMMFSGLALARGHTHKYATNKKVETITQAEAKAFSLVKEGSKILINKTYSFVFTFSDKPKMGYVVAKVEITDNAGNKVDNLELVGSYGMPAMKGAHDSDNQKFQLNKNKIYLLPINVAMPGSWELSFIINDKGKEIFRGKILFEA